MPERGRLLAVTTTVAEVPDSVIEASLVSLDGALKGTVTAARDAIPLDTGEVVACGANSAATAIVDPDGPVGNLVLPDPHQIGDYLSCATQLDLSLNSFEPMPRRQP